MGRATRLRTDIRSYKDSGGRVLLDPSVALRTTLPPAERDRLALKLATYLSDTADRATITPRITDRNRGLFGLGLGGTRPGTPEGELARFFMQFKNWPVAMARQTFDAEFRSGRPLSSSIPGTFQLIAGMTILGYLRNTLAGMASGKNPAPITPATLFHSLAQGGGAGIYGDFLFGNSSRFGQSIAETMAGPVLGQGLDLLSSTWNDLRDYATGEKKNLDSTAEALVRTGQRMLPFVNLYYARLAADYLVFHSLQESVNPGYLERSERRLRQQTGQTYWLSPSEHAQTFGR
jgi:hypothetical protein